MRKSVAERLVEFMPVDPPNEADECLPWRGYRDRDGYGRLAVGERRIQAHRVAYEQAHRVSLSSSQLVLHRCNRRDCVRVSHLYVGTHRDNSADARAAGTLGRGSRRRLSVDDVCAIRDQFWLRGASRNSLAKKYNVSTVTVSAILAARTHRDLPRPVVSPIERGLRRLRAA